MMERDKLNEIYKQLDRKAHEISKLLNCEYRYFNGHYHKNKLGFYEEDYFPIPVISVNGICDIEIDFDQISVTTKLTRDAAVSYNYDKVKTYCFEVYGGENYLNDFYLVGDTVSVMIDRIKRSGEQNVFFSFYFPFEVATNTVCEFVDFISNEGFFY